MKNDHTRKFKSFWAQTPFGVKLDGFTEEIYVSSLRITRLGTTTPISLHETLTARRAWKILILPVKTMFPSISAQLSLYNWRDIPHINEGVVSPFDLLSLQINQIITLLFRLSNFIFEFTSNFLFWDANSSIFLVDGIYCNAIFFQPLIYDEIWSTRLTQHFTSVQTELKSDL